MAEENGESVSRAGTLTIILKYRLPINLKDWNILVWFVNITGEKLVNGLAR